MLGKSSPGQGAPAFLPVPCSVSRVEGSECQDRLVSLNGSQQMHFSATRVRSCVDTAVTGQR